MIMACRARGDNDPAAGSVHGYVGEAVPQCFLGELADRCLRYFVNELHPVGHPPLDDSAIKPLENLVGV